MSTENALSTAVEPAATGDQHEDAAALDTTQQTEEAQAEPAKKDDEPAKKEKTPEERERIRAQRKIDRLVAQRSELRTRLEMLERQQPRQLTREPIGDDNSGTQSDNETLSLSRAELQKLIEKEARQLAPTIKQQEAEIEHRRAVVSQLAKDWGQEKFDTLASDLDDALDGLRDQSGQPKPAVDAIFESEDARALIEYLADPDHADEAEAIGRMRAVQAARAITKLELKLAEQKAKAKPQPSKAPAPIEPVRGGGTVNSLPSDSDSIDVWLKKERARLAAQRKGKA